MSDFLTEMWAMLFREADPRLAEKFKVFHRKNPVVYALFIKFSQEAKASGRKRFSHWMIANRIRWYSLVETSGKAYKLSNDYIALYARLLVHDHPEFKGFFMLKPMKKVRRTIPED
jgi:hypothetical protein